ncbi:MAG: mechanosensitive ion channel family protein [Myxococcota bacterium]
MNSELLRKQSVFVWWLRWALVFAISVFSLHKPVYAQAGPIPPNCSTPRKAVRSFLDNLNAGATVSAIRCFDWEDAGIQGTEARIQHAERLKRVLDNRGAVVYAQIPDTPEVPVERVALYYRIDTGELIPDESKAPEFFLTRRGTDWLFPSASVLAIKKAYGDLYPFDIEPLLEALPGWLTLPFLSGVALWQLCALLLVIGLGWLSRSAIAGVVASQSQRFLTQRGDAADRTVVARAANPIGSLAMAAVIWYLLPILNFGVAINDVIRIALRTLAAASAVLVAYRLVDVVSSIFQKRAAKTATKLDDQLVPLLRKIAKAVVSTLGVLFVLQNLNVDIGSLLAGATVGGLAFSFAAKDTVANLFGSIAIFADGPFQIGDWVIIDGTEGVVEEIGMRTTRLRTFYNSIVFVPNSKVANAVIDNYSGRYKRRVSTTLGIEYGSSPEQVEAFTDGIRAILRASPAVQQDAFEVHFRNFGDSALEVLVYFFLDVSTWSEELRHRHTIFLEIMRLASTLRVSFAFPTQTLHIERMAVSAGKPEPEQTKEQLAAIVSDFGPGGSLGRPDGFAFTPGFFAGSETKRRV